MGIGNTCTPSWDANTIGTANKYLGTNFDTIKAVYDHLDNIRTVAELGELERGLTGNTPDVTDNLDGSYTIAGNNGSITVRDGVSPIVLPNAIGDGITIVDSRGFETKIEHGLGKFTSFAYISSFTVPATPSSGTGTFVGGNLTAPTGYNVAPELLDDTHSLWMVSTIYEESIDNTWSNHEWTAPVRISSYTPVKGIDYFDGVSGTYYSYVYKSNAGAPSRPTTGSYNGSTESYPLGWLDNPPEPSAVEDIWVSVGRYREVSNSWVLLGWAEPRKITGSSGYTPVKGVDYIDGLTGVYHSYVYQNANSVPVQPSDGSYDGVSEVIPNGWSDNQTSPNTGEVTWVTHVKYQPTSVGNWFKGTWSLPAQVSGHTPVKGVDYIDGVNGDFTSWIYRTINTVAITPTGGSYDGTTEVIPTDWNDDPVAPANASEDVYMSKMVYRNTGGGYVQNQVWSVPVKISGEAGYTPAFGVDYFNGLEGKFTSFIYKMSATAPTKPVGGAFDGSVEVVPVGWFDDPSTPVGIDVLFVSQGIYKNTSAGVWEHLGWTEPVRFNGQDGSVKFVSQIFITQTTTPGLPTLGTYDGINEVYPVGWSNILTEPATDNERVYTSLTTYSQDPDLSWVHTAWTVPVLFAGGIVDSMQNVIFTLENDVNSLLADVIWNTTKVQEVKTLETTNTASIDTIEDTVATETAARVTLGTQLSASIATDKGILTANTLSLSTVETLADGTALALDVVKGIVEDPVSGSAASYGLIQQAKVDIGKGASSVTAITSRVDTLDIETGKAKTAQAQLILDVDTVAGDVNSLEARAFLGVNVDGKVTGVHVAGSETSSALILQADSVSFQTVDNVKKLYWEDDELTFAGKITADSLAGVDISGATGEFTGTLRVDNLIGEQASGAATTLSAVTLTEDFQKCVKFTVAATAWDRLIVIPSPFFIAPVGSSVDCRVNVKFLLNGTNLYSDSTVKGGNASGYFGSNTRHYTLGANNAATFQVDARLLTGSDPVEMWQQGYVVEFYRQNTGVTFS